MTSASFGQLPSGETIDALTLANSAGSSVQILTLGGIISALRVPDRQGQLADVVLGFDNLPDYLASHPYFGALCGRIAGRVTGGKLVVEGKTYTLARNDAPNHLHGGVVGLDRRVWSAAPVRRTDGADAVRLTYHSPDGEEGYPGNLDIAVTYTLTAANALVIESEASADRVTPLSLTSHSYFNLAGEGSGTIENHELQINAASYVAGDDRMTTAGPRASVKGQGNDFTRPRRVGDALPQLFKSHGDLYLLGNGGHRPAARVVEPRSGRVLEVTTDESCLQFYSAVALDGTLVGKSGRPYVRYAGLCLECQGFPDGSSRPEFGDILVRPGRPQRRRTTYAFSTL